MTEETIFATALDKRTPTDRSAYLDEACAGDAALRQRVEALLRAHDAAGDFLDRPAVEQIAACVSPPQDSTEAIASSRQADEAIAESPARARPGETQAEWPTGGGDDLSLDFLAPSRKPGSLGRLSHYEVMEVVGQGGMGFVLRAFDEVLHRVVAIKVMAPQLATNATARKRFRREAQAAAAVRDEHVVDIHAVEEVNGLPYLVMEYVNGISLQDRLDQGGPLELKEILRIGMQTATGLAKAHAQGLIHRDIKPANILLENGVQRVKITDFGLARAVDDASLTQSGVIAGTPQYMAPEQARGEAVDHRADLFSLGSVLYAMGTGRPPFRASGTMAVLKRVCEDTPRPVREVNPEIPGGLAAIIDKLHAKNPAERFQSAAEVAEVLSQHLLRLQQPVTAPEPEVRSVARRAAARPSARRWAAAAAVLLVLAGGLGVTEATGVTKLTATVIRIFSADGTLVVEVDDPNVRVSIDGEDIRISGAGPQEIRVRPGKHHVQATKDGRSLPIDQELVTITRGGKQVVRVKREAEPAPLPVQLRTILNAPRGTLAGLAFSRDGRWLAAASAEAKAVKLWKRTEAGWREDATLRGLTDKARGVAFSPDGTTLATGTHDGKVRLWNWDGIAWREGRTLKGHTQQVYAVAFAPDGKTLASAGGLFPESAPGEIKLWDVPAGRERRSLQRHALHVNGLAFSPDGHTLASAGGDMAVILWDVATGQPAATLEGGVDGLHSVAFAPDGKTLAAGGAAKAVKLWKWDGAIWRAHDPLLGHSDIVWPVAFSPDGKRLASGSWDRTVRLWDVATGQALATLPHTGSVWSVAFAPDGKTLAAGSADGAVRLWDLSEAGTDRSARPAARPFILPARGGKAERAFATLAEAVGAAAAGDTIEVRGDGPFWLDAAGVTIDRALTIRAGAGYRPVFKLAQSEPGQGRNKHLLDIYAPVTLEGLDFDRTGEHEGSTRERAALFVENGPLRMANCRLLTGGLAHYLVWLRYVREADIRNCLFAGPALRSICVAYCSDGDRLALTNCVFAGTSRAVLFTEQQDKPASSVTVRLIGNTLNALPVGWHSSSSRELKAEARDNIVTGAGVIDFLHFPVGKSWKELKTAVRWEWKRNLYLADRPPIVIDGRPATGSGDLDTWEAASPRFQGGDDQGWQAAMQKPDFWRLAADSPGKGAGEGGRDLGADVDLVGPGPAYERWKKTPAYRQWLKDTGQVQGGK